jgi:hypothetical protein
MSNTYRLVNPYIKGEFKTKMKAKNSIEAARSLYKNLSEHFNNNLPKFYFTLYKGNSNKGGKFYHFEISEKKINDEVNFSLESFEVKDENNLLTKFKDNLKQFKGRYDLEGGAKKKRKSKKRKSKRRKSKRRSSSSSSDSESEDYYRRAQSYVPIINQPISYFYYDPQVYNLNTVHIPTFYAYVTPYIEINLV